MELVQVSEDLLGSQAISGIDFFQASCPMKLHQVQSAKIILCISLPAFKTIEMYPNITCPLL
jgi:hypothetical protein